VQCNCNDDFCGYFKLDARQRKIIKDIQGWK
jgi:hypothetical protein